MLSVIAQQIMVIQQAIVKNVEEFEFEGTIIPLWRVPSQFGVFITMNPGLRWPHRAARQPQGALPPGRDVMVPDYRKIGEIILFSEGFVNTLPLSNKMAQLYALSSEQLSKQDHYGSGMRAVKSVLVAAGQLKRK